MTKPDPQCINEQQHRNIGNSMPLTPGWTWPLAPAAAVLQHPLRPVHLLPQQNHLLGKGVLPLGHSRQRLQHVGLQQWRATHQLGSASPYGRRGCPSAAARRPTKANGILWH
eukprot:CAMPEP_0117649216 /NCGR_PEP_ID=MMETSP0804-20121206/847_1 /TAXON_ID=1074897 /ORGANISM="Tetraselmis astigmatica, Strain CCMP880" /LENGTH=111 /DNA_ID=CAMNT_0005454925 /DNA_START=294 /DNA_END=629 /DNA_ORIENTATION=-